MLIWWLPFAACSHGALREAPPSTEPTDSAASRSGEEDAASIGSSAMSTGPRRHGVVIDAAAIARLRDSARRRTQAWRFTSARCDEAAAERRGSGYQGFEWADATASLALCWYATGDAHYATAAESYLQALLDDRFQVGDGKGGASVVTHDSGYGIRTFAAYSALAYDWLRTAPGMSPALQARVVTRLEQWLGWYAEHGYLRDHPISNYYWGYLAALSFAGLAVRGDAPIADTWLRRSWSELTTKVEPAFRAHLRGGGWPEGWQYGEYTATEVALVAEAFRTGAGVDVARTLPWLGDVVTHHMYALLPDERSVYDGGTWGDHPARPSALALAAVSIALDTVEPTKGAEARWMVAHALPPLRREQAWVGLLADRAEDAVRDPRTSAPTSLHVSGQGLTFVRSDWSRSAVWASLQAGPRLSEDHQDEDQGHIELWRGGDGLLVDGGDSEGSATSNHNTLLIDDGGRNMNYFPNQGVWGNSVRTTAFSDDDAIAVAIGDIGDAYAPSCARDGCKERTVEQLLRTFVYVRPSLLVVHDRVNLEQEADGATWAAHMTTPPVLAGDLASATVGQSRVDIRTIEPQDAERAALHEPTPSGEGPHRQNHPWGPMWRLEVQSHRGSRLREFLHFITVDRAEALPPPVRHLVGPGLRGADATMAGRRTVVLFAEPDHGSERSLVLGGHVALLLVLGLQPGSRYEATVSAAEDCTLRVRPSEATSARAATVTGLLRVDATPCGPS
jgi:hypothetical protein